MPIKDEQGVIHHFIGIRHDITDVYLKEQIIEKQSTDDLTGLPNRVKLLEDLERIDFPTISILNIDSFSEINDFYGLEIGDELLRHVAIKLKKLLDESKQLLYRLHGDEFAVLTKNKDYAQDHIDKIVTILLSIKKEPFSFDEQSIYISMTSGTASEYETVLGKANMALKFARKEKKFHQLFDASVQENLKFGQNLEWTNKIREAISSGRIITYYQPIMDLKSGEIKKYEALVRLKDTDGAIILPAQFLDISKRSRQYPFITKKMIENGITMASKTGFEISINLSIEDLESMEIVSYIEMLLTNFACGKNVVFELTETEEVRNYHAVRGFIELVKNKFDCKVAIDDFGSGYSNFEHLLELDFDYLKIDGSIITKLEQTKQSMVLMEAIIAFTEKLGIKTVAEFVCSEAIFNVVKANGIDFAQGFFVGKPKELI